MIVFFGALAAMIFYMLRRQRIRTKEAKTNGQIGPEKPAKDVVKKEKKKSSIFGTVIVLLILVPIGYLGYEKLRETQPRTQAMEYALCAGGVYDFANNKIPGKVRVVFRNDCWTQVTLPATVRARTDFDTDAELVFIDGARYVDGPGRQIWYGKFSRELFKVRGITSNGILKISFEVR